MAGATKHNKKSEIYGGKFLFHSSVFGKVRRIPHVYKFYSDQASLFPFPPPHMLENSKMAGPYLLV